MKKLFQQFFNDSRDLLIAPPCDKSIKRLAAIMALFGILGASFGIPFTGDTAYYGMLIICALFLFFKGGFKLSGPFAAFFLIIILNILIVDIPPFFKPVQRSILFILLTTVCSSALETELAVRFRAYLFKYLIWGIIFIGVGSFFCYFLGINLMKTGWGNTGSFEEYSTNGGRFGGLSTHSMMLGPIAMIAALFFYFMYQKNTNKIYLLLFFFSAMSVVLAASRAAILSLIVAIAYNLIMGNVNLVVKKRMIGILVFSALLTIPISGIVLKGVITKQSAREKQGSSALDSRQGKFSYRINEFKSSPLIGVGMCAIDINSGDSYSEYEGRIEPGTSHLAVLSMLGLAGFAVYLVILYKVYSNTKGITTLRSRFVFTCFIAFFVHAWFEGYILSAGGFLALLYWVLVGQCIDTPAINRIYNRQKLQLSRK